MKILATGTQQFLLIVLATFGLAASSMAANMSQPQPGNAVVVSFADLNLQEDSGVQTLYQRLRHGARKSCGTVSAMQAALYRQNRECVRKALHEAIEFIDNDKLKQLYSS